MKFFNVVLIPWKELITYKLPLFPFSDHLLLRDVSRGRQSFIPPGNFLLGLIMLLADPRKKLANRNTRSIIYL